MQFARSGAILLSMRALLPIGLLCAGLAFAAVPDTTADRTAIEHVIASLSTAKPVSVLFTADADSQLDLLTPPPADEKIWSEVFHLKTPYIVVQSIRFLTPEIALVDAAGTTQFGSATIMRRVPVWLVMKKEGADWKIASLRLPAASDFV